jgi:UDP-N-acetylglucosamine 2-epimerase (non-hydrolysing)
MRLLGRVPSRACLLLALLGCVCWAEDPLYRPSVVVVVGTRPDVIKLASTIALLRDYYSQHIALQILCTGQHRELLTPMLRQFNITPDIDLDLMPFSRNGSASFVAKSMESITETFRSLSPRPAAVVVQGDTNTALAASLAAFYARIPVVHIEAGLRTWDIASPYPEEFNRRAISLIAALSLAPTEKSKENLLRDGVSADSISVTGNTVIDGARQALSAPLGGAQAAQLAQIESHLRSSGGEGGGEGARRPYVLISSNRQENFGQPLAEIIGAVRTLSQRHPEVLFFFLLHMNPQSRGPVTEALPGLSNVVLLEAVDYAPFVRLLQGALLAVSDSGGMQEEAAALAVPFVVLRCVSPGLGEGYS